MGLLLLAFIPRLGLVHYWLFVDPRDIGLVAGSIDILAALGSINGFGAAASGLVLYVVFIEVLLTGILLFLAPLGLGVIVFTVLLPCPIITLFSILPFVKEKVEYHIQ